MSVRLNYKDIYIKMILEICPEKLNDPIVLWKLDHLDSNISVLDLNNYLFNSENELFSQMDSRLRSYTEEEIVRILIYQKKYNKTNTDIVRKYSCFSRTTLYNWKKRFKTLS
jgi:hypothetical protein